MELGQEPLSDMFISRSAPLPQSGDYLFTSRFVRSRQSDIYSLVHTDDWKQFERFSGRDPVFGTTVSSVDCILLLAALPRINSLV